MGSPGPPTARRPETARPLTPNHTARTRAGRKKQEKRIKQMLEERRVSKMLEGRMQSKTERALKKQQKETGKAFVVLEGGAANFATSVSAPAIVVVLARPLDRPIVWPAPVARS